MPPAQVKVDFGNCAVTVCSTVENGHFRCVPPARTARAIKHFAAFPDDAPHGAIEWSSLDRAQKVEQPVIERAASFHLKINPAIQPLDHLKHLGRSPINDQVIGTQSAELWMRRLKPQPHLVWLVEIR